MKACQITGKKTISGHHVSHSNRKTKRTFAPNLFYKKYFVEEEGRWITLRVTAAGMRTIDKKGLTKAIIDAYEQGHIR